MNFFAKIWAIITGWFTGKPESTPAVDNPEPTQTIPEVGTDVPEEGTLADAETIAIERRKDIDFTTQAITKHAEHYENHAPDLYTDWSHNPELFVEACFHVNWPLVVKAYSDDTIRRVMGSGTNFNFKGHDALRALVTAAVSAESAWRSPEAPATNGMDSGSTTIPEGYARKTGAGGGLSSWVWTRKDRGPTAEERRALRDFQAKLDGEKK